MNENQYWSALRDLLRGARPSRSELLEEQSKRLRCLVDSAYRRVPYYRRLFDREGLKPSDIQSAEDLCRLPPTSKSQLSELPTSEILAEGASIDRLIHRRTSGSTGEPFSVFTSWFEDRLLACRRMKPLLEWGWRPWEQLVKVKIPNPTSRSPAAVKVLNRLRILRSAQIDSLLPPEQVASELLNLQPRVVVGYPAVLSGLAPHLGRGCTGLESLRFVVAGGATMTALMRRQIEEGFEAPVKEMYASHEFNLIAAQCSCSDRLHVADDTVIVEVVDGDRAVGPGEIGEVLITGLVSFTQPFLRFRLGDRAQLGQSPCPCGAPFSTLQRVHGRLQDWITFRDGTLNSPDFVFSRLAVGHDWIRQFQMVQHDREHVILSLVPSRPPASNELAAVEKVMKTFGRGQIDGRVELKDHLPSDPSGKLRVSISKVHPFYD
jgi:phenylacetate-CoA ligase